MSLFGIEFKKVDLQKLPLKKIAIIGQFIIIVFCVRSCHLKELAINKNGLDIKMYEGKVNEFTTTVNKLGEKVSLQDQVITQKNKDIEKELLKNSTLVAINEQTKFEASSKIKDVLAKYYNNNAPGDTGDGGKNVVTIHDTVFKNGVVVSANTTKAVKVGTKFKADTSQWYKVYGKIGEAGVLLDCISFKSAFTLNVG